MAFPLFIFLAIYPVDLSAIPVPLTIAEDLIVSHISETYFKCDLLAITICTVLVLN
jgi:hypothetical protein